MKKIFLLVGVIFLSGCRYTYVHDRYPVYEIPPKADVAKVSAEDLESLSNNTRERIISTVYNLKKEATALRKMLESYNRYASRKNEEYKKEFEQ